MRLRSAMQGFENTNGAQPSFEPFASSQDPWKAFPDPPAQAEQAPVGAGWADFEGAAPFQAASSHAQPSGLIQNPIPHTCGPIYFLT